MFRKSCFSFFTLAAIILTGALFVFAQTAPVRGKVVLTKADGTTEPVADATVEPYRTDIKTKLSPAKTDKKGNFNFAGFTLGQTFALVVSAPNIKPAVFPNVQGGMDRITISVVAGDGKQLTEDEARQVIAAVPSPSSASNSQGGAVRPPSPADSAAAKKQREEDEKKIADITAKNAKIKGSQAIMDKAAADAKKAFEAQNYDEAIVQYDAAYKAEPNFVGTAPTYSNNKALALVERAKNLYNRNTKVTDISEKVANKTKVTKDFADAIDAYNASWLVIKNNTSTEVAAPKVAEIKMQTLRGAQNAMQLMVTTDAVDSNKIDVDKTLAQEYLAAETDQAKKLKAQTLLGDLYRIAGDFDKAAVEYRKSLEMSPSDPDALANLGLSLFSAGESASPRNTATVQEGLNYMQRFVDTAPENHPLKASVREIIEDLKAKKMTPEKTEKKPAGKKKP